MATSISAILIPCLKSFNQLHERVERPDYSHEGEVPSVSWGDELGRLRIWAANIGAHQTGQSSLEFRLRDASHISTQIKNLLRELDQSLNDILDELSEDGTKASEDDETSAAWPDDNSTTEFQQLHEEVVNIVDCLYQLSMLVRKPAQHDLLVGSRMGDKAEFEFYDNEHVRNLHPRTEEQICQRLGRAITRTRKYLNYRERHHRKLEKGIEEVQGIQRTTTASGMSETIATDFKIHNIDFEETSSDLTQTSYAPSLIDGGRVTIPPPPRESAGGKPFECPYCFFIIDIKSTRSWTRHIFKDIKPYVCTFADCRTPDRLYDSRREWFFHETTEHHRVAFVCALCKDTLKSSKQYERHVACHLEELALFALPRTEMDDAEIDDNDPFDARASTSEIGVALDTAHSSVHSDHSLSSVIDDEESTQEAEAAATAKSPRPPKEKEKPIKFKDAIGRTFNFPFEHCNTWSGMEYFIREAFLHIVDLGPHVADGQYDLLGPKDEVIMPSIWESVIEPGWEITMHMWPIPEPPAGEDALGILELENKSMNKKEKNSPYVPPANHGRSSSPSEPTPDMTKTRK